MRVQAVEIGEGASDGKSQLCTGAQPSVGRQCTVDSYERAVREVMVVQESPSESGRALRVLTLDDKHIGSRR